MLQHLLRGFYVAAALALTAAPARAQRDATIAGRVRDSARAPIAGAEIVANPGERRARSDSTGSFVLIGLDAGAYVVTARAPGYQRDRWDVSLNKSGRVEITFVLAKGQGLPDGQVDDSTPRLIMPQDCATLSFDGFRCRSKLAQGIFLDRDSIEERAVRYTADLFRGVPGFRVEGAGGRAVARMNRRSACVSTIVDGRPLSPGNPVPPMASEITAIEIYLESDSVPGPYKRYVWPRGSVARSGRCVVVGYWTIATG